MADSYVRADLETDPDAIAQEGFDYIASKVTGWTPAEASVETLLIESQALQHSVDRTVLLDVLDEIFRRFGALAGIPPLDPTAATVQSTWTMVNNSGYTIPAGTQVAVDDGQGGTVGFRTLADVTVPNGSTATSPGQVTLQAVETGTRTSGLGGTATLIDALAYVQTVTLVGVSTGGTDGETTAAYMDRLAALLRLQSAVAILIRDFEVTPREIAGVARAVAIDNYNAATSTAGVEGHVTVGVVDADGQALPTNTKNAVKALLEAKRVVNLTVHVIDPAYTAIDVAFTATALPGFNTAAVETSAEAAVTAYLDPANWGLPSSGDGDTDWINRTVVRYLEVANVINNVEGVDYITALTVEGGTVNVTLTGGPITMTTPGAITGTINAP